MMFTLPVSVRIYVAAACCWTSDPGRSDQGRLHRQERDAEPGLDYFGSATTWLLSERVGWRIHRGPPSYGDGWGNEMKTVLGEGNPLASKTLFSYNVLGQRTQVTDPRGI